MPTKSNLQDTQQFGIQASGVTLGAKGLDLRISPRNKDPEALEELNNAQFRDGSVFGRRNGHDGYEVRDAEPDPSTSSGLLTETDSWVLGHGKTFTTVPGVVFPGYAVETLHCQYPGRLQGLTHRDDEVVVWTGDRLLSFPEGNPNGAWSGSSSKWVAESDTVREYIGIPAVMPTATAFTVPTDSKALLDPSAGVDSSLGRKFYVVAFRDTDGGSPLAIAVYDRFTNAKVYEQIFDAATNPTVIRCVFSAGFHVVYCLDGSRVHQIYASESDIQSWTLATDSPETPGGSFDVAYITESLHLVAWCNGTQVFASYFKGAAGQGGPFPEGTQLDTGTHVKPTNLGVTVARNGDIGLIWLDKAGGGTTVQVRVYNQAGVALGAEQEFDDKPEVTLVGLAISPRWLPSSDDGSSVFDCYCNHTDGGSFVKCGDFSATSLHNNNLRGNSYIASRAFRVGDFSAIWYFTSFNAAATALGGPSHIVPTTMYLLVGQLNKQQVAGFADWGQSYNLSYSVSSVLPDPMEDTYGSLFSPTTALWHTASIRRASGPGFGSDQAELVVRDLNFLPPLRTAQYGKSTYFAGAAVRVYDGVSLTEVGVAIPPNVVINPTNGAGTLSNATTPGILYQYRVYLTYKNAQGEVCRSSAVTQSQAMITPNDTNTLVISNIPCTDKVGAQFEIYRTQGGLTTFNYLATVPTPNDPTALTVSYVDEVSDASFATFNSPIDPFNPAPGQTYELSEDIPRGCEVISAYTDRLFLSGGEIPRGQVDFSKYISYGRQAGFSSLVGTVVADSTGGQITSLSGMNDTPVVFTAQNVLVLQGQGPDNFGNGGYLPTMAVLGRGALVHDGTVSTNVGVAYWAARGPLLLTPGFQVMEIADQVQPLAVGLIPSGVASPSNSNEIRWYTANGRGILFDYRLGLTPGNGGRWATFSGLPVAGVICRGSRQAELAMTNGFFFVENNTHETDNGSHYELTWKTGQLRPEELVMGNNTIYRVGLTGEYRGPHTLSCWAYYDGSAWYDQLFTWDPSVDIDLGVPWTQDGTALTDATATFSAPDGVYRFSKRLRRGPFATLSLRFSDGGPTNDSLVPHELALEIGEKPGLTLMTHRDFGGPADTE